MRNPDWVRDEVILALDLYIRAGRQQLPASHPDVVRLSALLQRLPIHPMAARPPTFRYPEGISMILVNFLGVEPDQDAEGLGRNNHLHHEAWVEYADQPEELRRVAAAIEEATREESTGAALAITPDDIFPEG